MKLNVLISFALTDFYRKKYQEMPTNDGKIFSNYKPNTLKLSFV